VATYLGKLPARMTPLQDSVRAERESLAKKAQKLSNDLNVERARSRKLQKRLENQAADTAK